MELSEYQTQYDALQVIINEANKNVSFLKENAKDFGFYFSNNEFKKSKTILAYVVRCAYYDTYVGEKGAMYRGCEYAEEINDNLDIKALGEEVIALKEKSFKCAQEATPGPNYKPNPITSEEFELVFKKYSKYFPEYISYPQLKSYKYKKKGSSFYSSPSDVIDTTSFDREKHIKDCTKFIECFTYEYEQISYRYSGGNRPEECVDDSGFTIGKYDKKYIDIFEETSYEDEFDVYYHAGKVKW